jgi:AcrR family transcriptional regulator
MTVAKKKTPKARKSAGAPRLGRDDWLDAAFAAVVEEGFDGARVLTLAERLGVTRGSFYWHFADHAALIDALLKRWQASEVAVHKSMEQQLDGSNPAADLEQVLDIALAHAGTKLDNMVFELAMRARARKDPAVARILVQVDETRMALFQEKFLRLTGDPLKSTELAGLFYLAIVGGNQALSRPATPPRIQQFIKGIIADYLIYRQQLGGKAIKKKV